MIEFRSDNAAGIAPPVLQAIVDANVGSALAYGDDAWTERLQAVVREVFEHPDAMVYPVASGTAANALSLSAMIPPWGSVLCHQTAHALRTEGGATSMLSGGGTLVGLPGDEWRVSPESLAAALDETRWGDPHHSQPTVVSLTNLTDYGTLYTPAHIRALREVAVTKGLFMHMDGARIANAVAALHCSPADLTWRAGIDVLSLGAIKNGGGTCDAIVSFDPSLADSFLYRVKRAGHVASKMRFHSAQLIAYLTDGLWLKLARNSNDTMRQLADGLTSLGVDLFVDPPANMAFVRLDAAIVDRMEQADLLFYRTGRNIVRLVTSWQTTPDDVDEALRRIKAAL